MEVFCIHCGERIALGTRVQTGIRFTCPSCQAYLELINADTLELDWAYDEPFGEYQRTHIMFEQWRTLGEGTDEV